MTTMTSTIHGILDQIASRPNSKNDGDYIENGILYCGSCRTPKQALIDWIPDENGNSSKKLVPVSCACAEAKQQRQRQIEKERQFSIWMRQNIARFGLSDPSMSNYTFENDDTPNSHVSKVCRKYVEKWDEMLKDGIGLLFHGSVGTGKSFYGCCIANALIERKVPALVTSFPRIIGAMQSSWDSRQQVLDHLRRFRCLAIDDLGAERDTSFAAEQVFSVIDERYQSRLPLIVTTNLSPEEMQATSKTEWQRVFDRVLEMCPISVSMVGISRRTTGSRQRTRKAREILLH